MEQNNREAIHRPDREQEKKSAHVGRKAAATAVILALLGGGSYFGLGIGNPEGGWINPQTPTVTQEAPATTPQATAAPETTVQPTTQEGVLKLVVKEGEILYQGVGIAIVDLEEALLRDYKPGSTIELTDDHAIKSVYDEVSAMLEKLKLPVDIVAP